jgi:hypothetical protein
MLRHWHYILTAACQVSEVGCYIYFTRITKCHVVHRMCPAGLLQGLAAACEQVAAVLTQQQQEPVQLQHPTQQQQQQHQQQQQRQAAQLVAQLSSPVTACCLLCAWNGLTIL